MLNLVTEEVTREIGKSENLRLIGVSLCRAVPNVNDQLQVPDSSVFIMCPHVSLKFFFGWLIRFVSEMGLVLHFIPIRLKN